jgi:peroxiredoxin
VIRLIAAAMLVASFAANGAELKRWPGGPTPALELEDMTGQAHRLADYRGKVVLVNFWATWCEPCRAEMPSMDGLRRSLQGQPFEVLAVNLAEPLSRIERFLGTMPLGFPLLRDRDGSVAKAWKARLLPASFLIGRDGRIRYVAYGELDWTSEPVRSRVNELLG